MNTITTILQPQPDGTLHLPVPAELRNGAVEVTATLRAADDSEAQPSTTPAVPQASAEMIRRRLEAFEALRAMGGLSDQIPDPVQWQREQREDRPLAGRE